MITFIWLQQGAASYEVAAWRSTKTHYLVSVSHFSCWCHWTSPTSYSHRCSRFHGVLRLVNRPQAQADSISRSFLGTKTPLYTSGLLGFSGESLTWRAVSGEASRGALESIPGYLTDADSQLTWMATVNQSRSQTAYCSYLTCLDSLATHWSQVLLALMLRVIQLKLSRRIPRSAFQLNKQRQVVCS